MNAPKSPRDFFFNVDYFKYLAILREQKWFILVFCISAISTSIALTYIYSEKYQAAAMIFYRPVESSILRQKSSEAFGAPVPTPSFKVIGQTLRDIVASENILRPVVEELHLDRTEDVYHPVWYQRWYQGAKDFIKEYSSKLMMILRYGRIIEEDPVSKAIIGLRETIEISATKESYVFVLSVKDKYPQRAAMIVDIVGNTLVEWLKSQDKDPATERYKILGEQMAIKEKDMKSLHRERESLLSKAGIVSVRDETDKGVKNIYEMELESERLSSLMQEKRKKIEKYIDEESKRGKAYVNPSDLKRMQSEKLFDEIELDGLAGKQSVLKGSIAAKKGQLQKLTSVQQKLDDLDIRVEAETRDYQHLKDMYLESFERIATVKSVALVMHRAAVPGKPVSPIKLYHVGLTAVLSLIFSTGLIYVLAYFNIRIFFTSKGVRARSDNMGKSDTEQSNG